MATNCENCTKIEKCEIKNDERKLPETIPYIAHEAALDRAERHTKRWMVTCFILIGIIFSMIIGFLIYESQFETYYYEQDGEGVNIVGDSNEVSQDEPTPENQEEASGQS